MCVCELTGSRSAAPCSVPVGEVQTVFPGWPEAHPYSPANCESQRRAFSAPRGLDYQKHTQREDVRGESHDCKWMNVSIHDYDSLVCDWFVVKRVAISNWIVFFVSFSYETKQQILHRVECQEFNILNSDVPRFFFYRNQN